MKPVLSIPPALLLLLALVACPVTGQAETGRGEESKRTARELKIRIQGCLAPRVPRAVTVAELEELPLTELTTFDPYLKRTVTYKGVLLKELVAAFGAPGTSALRMGAVDEYTARFSREDWLERGFLLATRMDGEKMSLRESGPVKVVMPFDEETGRRFTPQWIWMVNAIEFLD